MTSLTVDGYVVIPKLSLSKCCPTMALRTTFKVSCSQLVDSSSFLDPEHSHFYRNGIFFFQVSFSLSLFYLHSNWKLCLQILKISVIILDQVANGHREEEAERSCCKSVWSVVSTSGLTALCGLILSLVGCELGVVCQEVIYFLICLLGGMSGLSFWVI